MKKPFLTAALLALITPQLAYAQQGYVWSYERYISSDVFETSLILSYGVPETDDRQFFANCAIGANRTYSVVTLGADIGGMADAASAEVTFLTDSGYSQSYSGEVVRHEEFIHGIEFTLENDDPFWTDLPALGSFAYRVNEHETAWLNADGGGPAMHAYAMDCANIGDLSPESSGTGGSAGGSKG